MYKVIWKNENHEYEREFDNLDPAMEWAKVLSVFVTIKSDEYEIVGKFGTDSVNNGKLPDGYDYQWYKRRIPT
jgi:hypothetical protein